MRAFLSVMLLCGAGATAAELQTPYAGQEQRDIKALSSAEIAQYLEGAGMGFAKAAELNHFPGPKHVLELAGKLGLSSEQVAETERIHRSMKDRASGLGRQLVSLERQLDRQFADGTVTADSLQGLLAKIARIRGKIRNTHLQAHLQQRRVLTGHQVQAYDRLRGYGSGTHRHDH